MKGKTNATKINAGEKKSKYIKLEEVPAFVPVRVVAIGDRIYNAYVKASRMRMEETKGTRSFK